MKCESRLRHHLGRIKKQEGIVNIYSIEEGYLNSQILSQLLHKFAGVTTVSAGSQHVLPSLAIRLARRHCSLGCMKLPAGLSPPAGLPHAALLPDGLPHRDEPLNTQRDCLPQSLETRKISLCQSSPVQLSGILTFPTEPETKLGINLTQQIFLLAPGIFLVLSDLISSQSNVVTIKSYESWQKFSK